MSAARRPRHRLPDEVRAAAVRAWLFLSWTVVSLTLATLASYGRSPLLAPSLVATALGVFGTVWCLLDVVIARQIAAQRMRGPNSASPLAGSREPKRPSRPTGRQAPLQG